MPKRTKTFTIDVEYNYFEPGALVTPTSNRSVLDRGRVYCVLSCREPLTHLDNDCVVFVKPNPDGVPRKWGVSTYYLREVSPDEITTSGCYLKPLT